MRVLSLLEGTRWPPGADGERKRLCFVTAFQASVGVLALLARDVRLDGLGNTQRRIDLLRLLPPIIYRWIRRLTTRRSIRGRSVNIILFPHAL
jgi:hypothetical protein